jgi:hypothetical protein
MQKLRDPTCQPTPAPAHNVGVTGGILYEKRLEDGRNTDYLSLALMLRLNSSNRDCENPCRQKLEHRVRQIYAGGGDENIEEYKYAAVAFRFFICGHYIDGERGSVSG